MGLVTGLLTLPLTASICPPVNPGPPAADACDNPDADVSLQTLETGASVESVFVPWTMDGTHTPMTRGGQGADMLGVRYRLRSPRALTCLGQNTVVTADGVDGARRSESLRVYATEDPQVFTTRTLWVVLPPVSDEAQAVLNVTAGGRTFTRQLVLRSDMAFPRALGVSPTRVCRGEDVPAWAGVDRPALPGLSLGLGYSRAAVLTGAPTELVFASGATTAPFTLRADTAGTLEVTAAGFVAEQGTFVEVVDGPATLRALPQELGVMPGRGAVVRLELGCASASATTVNLTSAPAGVLGHPQVVVLSPGRLAVDVPVTASSAAPGTEATLTVTPVGGEAQSVRFVFRSQGVAPSAADLKLDEVLDGSEGIVLDAACSGAPGPLDAFAELWNAGREPVALAGLRLEVVGYGDARQTLWVSAGQSTLGPGERLLLLAETTGGNSTSSWCAGVASAQARGLVELRQGESGIYAASYEITSSDGVVDRLQRPTEGSYGVMQAWVGQSSTGTHVGRPGHVVDRPFTPGAASDAVAP